ncbi:MAG: hypothetical protein EXS30_04590 [Pedosphaera sp.]|nr:hypothetical protein [Pedosphaera sp.]
MNSHKKIVKNKPILINRTLRLSLVATGFFIGLALDVSVRAQSSDALIDKLVDKGILSVKEANELRDESDKGFTSAYQVKSGMPDWVNSLRFNGDLRLRFDGIHTDNPAFLDRNRFRYRARFGFTAVMRDDFEVGLRLMSGEGTSIDRVSDPISGNTTFDNNGAKKGVFIDLVYAKWSPLNTADWSASFTGGKMENPFVFSGLIFDPDYTPEGFGQNWSYTIDANHSAKLNLGGFLLDELRASSNDPYLLGAQVRLDSKWSPKIQTSFGVAGLAITGTPNLSTANVPDQNKGNTRVNVGTVASPVFVPAVNFNPIVVDASLTYLLDSFPLYSGAFPIRFGGDYVNNLATGIDNQAYSIGVTFGKSGKRGTWDLAYHWKSLEADSWFEEFVDSDTGAFYQSAPIGGSGGYGPGTNLRGHHIKAAYSPLDSLTLGLTYFLFDLIKEAPSGSDSQTSRIQIDATWKF